MKTIELSLTAEEATTLNNALLEAFFVYLGKKTVESREVADACTELLERLGQAQRLADEAPHV